MYIFLASLPIKTVKVMISWLEQFLQQQLGIACCLQIRNKYFPPKHIQKTCLFRAFYFIYRFKVNAFCFQVVTTTFITSFLSITTTLSKQKYWYHRYHWLLVIKNLLHHNWTIIVVIDFNILNTTCWLFIVELFYVG